MQSLSARTVWNTPDAGYFPHLESHVKRRRFGGMNTTMKHYKPTPGRTRAPMAEQTYRLIRERLATGEYQHDIAADLGINQGRVSEVKTGKRGDPNQLSLI